MECFIPASEPRDVLVERHNRLSAAIRILNEAYQVFNFFYNFTERFISNLLLFDTCFDFAQFFHKDVKNIESIKIGVA